MQRQGMDKYVVRASHGGTESEDHDQANQSAAKRPRISTTSSQAEKSNTEKMRQYKSKLRYNLEWTAKWRWVEYDNTKMVCFARLARDMANQQQLHVAHGSAALSITG